MPLRAPPIDFNAIRAAIARTVQAATGLDSNSVVLAQPEAPLAKRPETPFCEFMVTTVAQQFGSDAILPTDDPDVWRYVGPRLCTVQFQFYGETHEQAYNLACLWQGALDQEPFCDMLRAASIVVWGRDTVTDVSALLATGYEGRAALNVSFGLHSSVEVNVGSIATVPVLATMPSGPSIDTVNFTVDLMEG